MKNILIIDDEISKLDESKGFQNKYACKGYRFFFAKDQSEAFRMIEKEREISLILLDIVFENMNTPEGFEKIKRISREIWPTGNNTLSGNEYGLPMLDDLRRTYPDIPVIMLSSKRVPSILLWCWKHGACYYIMKPPESRETLQKDLDTFSRYVQSDLLIGNSHSIQRVKKQISLVSENENAISVVITGESGTGKELVARSIHECGNRRKNPFIVVDCAAIPATLIESELFGHKKGSFTGATEDKKGKIKNADGGILFLDEIGEMPLDLQSKMLRAMNRGMQFSPIGSTEEIECDVQVIAATNKDLHVEVKNKNFREDLYYRLNVFPINIPPLRERLDDVPMLADHFLNQFKNNRYRSKLQVSEFSPEALSFLKTYKWPGNVRELENEIEYALTQTSGSQIKMDALRGKIHFTEDQFIDHKIELEPGFDLKEHCERIRWQLIKQAYDTEISRGIKGIIERVAGLTGISNPSDIQRTILPQTKKICPDLTEEIERLFPVIKRNGR